MNIFEAHDSAKRAASKWGGVWLVFRRDDGTHSYGCITGGYSARQRVEREAIAIIGRWCSRDLYELKWERIGS